MFADLLICLFSFSSLMFRTSASLSERGVDNPFDGTATQPVLRISVLREIISRSLSEVEAWLFSSAISRTSTSLSNHEVEAWLFLRDFWDGKDFSRTLYNTPKMDFCTVEGC